MKKAVLLIIYLALQTLCFAQNYNDPQNMKVNVDQEAYFPPGDDSLYRYLYYNIVFPDELKSKVIQGEVIISFIVETDGTLSDFSVIKSLEKGIDEEVIRLIKPLKYAPTIMNGVKMRKNVLLSVPIRKGAG